MGARGEVDQGQLGGKQQRRREEELEPVIHSGLLKNANYAKFAGQITRLERSIMR